MRVEVDVVEIRIRLPQGDVLEVLTPYGPVVLKRQIILPEDLVEALKAEIEKQLEGEGDGGA